MALKTLSKIIDGHEYTCTQMGAEKSRAIYPRVMIEGSKILLAMRGGGGFAEVNPDFLNYLHKQFEPHSTVRANCVGNALQLDIVSELHFAETGPVHENRWLLFALEVQYPDFLALAKGKVSNLLAMFSAEGLPLDPSQSTPGSTRASSGS